MADQVPSRLTIPLSTAVRVSLEAGFEVVAASPVGVVLAVTVDSVLLDEEDSEDTKDVLVGSADEVLASGSPSRKIRKV